MAVTVTVGTRRAIESCAHDRLWWVLRRRRALRYEWFERRIVNLVWLEMADMRYQHPDTPSDGSIERLSWHPSRSALVEKGGRA